VDEIPWCDHSNETSSAVLLHGTICFVRFEKMKFRIFLEFLLWPLLGVKGLNGIRTHYTAITSALFYQVSCHDNSGSGLYMHMEQGAT